MSECELACPPSGHVTTPVDNLHYFCWPSLSLDVLFSFLEFFCDFEFCGGASVLTMSPQHKIKKLQRKSAFFLCPCMADYDHYL